MQVIRNGFIWLDVTEKANEIYESGLFELYSIFEDEIELIESQCQLDVMLDLEVDICIKVGSQEKMFKDMYNFLGNYSDILRNAYEEIPDKQFNYEQFIIVQLLDFINEEII
jgi:hypothetical protein